MERNIEIKDKITEDNYKVFALLSNYLNHAPDFIETEEMDGIVNSGVSYEYAFSVILALPWDLIL